MILVNILNEDSKPSKNVKKFKLVKFAKIVKIVKLLDQCGGQMRTSDKMESAAQPQPNYN